jgi:hypothetical protein
MLICTHMANVVYFTNVISFSLFSISSGKKVSLCWLHVPGLTWAMNANLSKAEPSTLTIESIAT